MSSSIFLAFFGVVCCPLHPLLSPFSEFEDLLKEKPAKPSPPVKVTIQKVTLPPDKRRPPRSSTPRILNTQTPKSTNLSENLVTLPQSGDTNKPITLAPGETTTTLPNPSANRFQRPEKPSRPIFRPASRPSATYRPSSRPQTARPNTTIRPRPLNIRPVPVQRPSSQNTFSRPNSWQIQRPTPRPSSTKRPSFRPSRRPPSQSSTLPSSSLFSQASAIIAQSQSNAIKGSMIPDDKYIKSLFNKFMTRLTNRGLLRKVPFRHIKIVFFNLLTAIGNSVDEEYNIDLMNKYLGHFNRSNVDNERRFSLNGKDFKRTSELLDQLIFNHLSDSFAGASGEFPRPNFTTRPTPAWISMSKKTTPKYNIQKNDMNFGSNMMQNRPQPVTEKTRTTRTSYQDFTFALPALEDRVTEEPFRTSKSTTTFGGVASNTARPTTKSILAEVAMQSHIFKPKFQFMHEPEKFKEGPMKMRSTTTKSPMTTKRIINFEDDTQAPPFYPQLVQNKPDQDLKNMAVSINPNFNNKENMNVTKFDPLAGLFEDMFKITTSATTRPTRRPSRPLRPKRTTRTPTRIPLISTEKPEPEVDKNQWDQILNKLTFALDKLSDIDERKDPNILDNPQYISNNGDLIKSVKKNNTDVEVNLISYDDDYDHEKDEKNVSIDYQDYFQAIFDADNLSLDDFAPMSKFSTIKPNTQTEDYIYVDDENFVDNLLTIPENPLPGVGNKNPVPLSNFPTKKPTSFFDKISRFPVNVPIPLTEAEKLGFPSILNDRPKEPVSIGSSRVKETGNLNSSRKKLTVPSIIKLIFGEPTNMTEVRMSIPDFTSSGPVNIPSSLQLYGNIGQYLNMTTTTRAPQKYHDHVHSDHSYHEHADLPHLDPSHYIKHADIVPMLNKKPYLQNEEIPMTLNGQPLTRPSSGASPANLYQRIDTDFLAALVEALENSEKKKIKPKRNSASIPQGNRPSAPIPQPNRGSLQIPQQIRGSVQIPQQNRGSIPIPQQIRNSVQIPQKNRGSIPIPTTQSPQQLPFSLPTSGALPKPQSLAALETYGLPSQPVPILWNQDKTVPRQQLPPYYKESLQNSNTFSNRRVQTGSPDKSEFHTLLSRISQSPYDSTIARFKSPPMIFPLESEDNVQNIYNENSQRLYRSASTTTREPFMILQPQSLPNLPLQRSRYQSYQPQRPSRVSQRNILDLILRQKSFRGQRRLKRALTGENSPFILKPPAILQGKNSKLKCGLISKS